MKLLTSFIAAMLLSIALTFAVSAQTKPVIEDAATMATKDAKYADGTDVKPKPKPKTEKAPPAFVEFDAKQIQDALAKRDAAKLANLEAENLMLKLERAQVEFQKLRDAAASAQAAYQAYLRDTAAKLGIPKEELPSYEFSDADGKFTLKRKATAKQDSGSKTDSKDGQ